MKLLPELLSSYAMDVHNFNAVVNAHGLYNTEQFVLRLSPENHRLINKITDKNVDSRHLDDRTIQAYSTYLHETIHWWQHVGSTTGFMMSLCYPLQTHSNCNLIREWCDLGEAKKSIKTVAFQGELSGKTHLDPRQNLGNTIVNNTMDFEFFKRWILQPEKSVEIYNDRYFESQGHCFHVVYGNVCSIIYELMSRNSKIFHNGEDWIGEFESLTSKKTIGYYYGSPLIRRRVGVVEIFEGQACFSQMQFLANARGSISELEDFKNIGLLHGVYEKAFNEFLSLSMLDRPKSILDPIVGLFLLICDLSINPVEGFPCQIKDFASFVNDADPGIRFEMLCRAVSTIGSEIGSAVKEYSKKEYMEISSLLLDECGLIHPSAGWDSIQKWIDESSDIKILMQEHASFKYSSENVVLRVMLSHFIALTLDKRNHPEFFCWPGYWKTNSHNNENTKFLWLKHLSLFSDKEDDNGVFIRQAPGRAPDALKKTLNEFYANTGMYDLSRQWVLYDGGFLFNFKWMSEKHDEAQWQRWADVAFEKQYGVRISNIVI